MRRRQLKKIRQRTIYLVRGDRSTAGKVAYRRRTEQRAVAAYVRRRHHRMPTTEVLNLRCFCGGRPVLSVFHQWRVRCNACGRKSLLWLLPAQAVREWTGVTQERNGAIAYGMLPS